MQWCAGFGQPPHLAATTRDGINHDLSEQASQSESVATPSRIAATPPSTPESMPKIHTHYDNLKVARNAPPEVIRAAYKTLSQKFHPDRNPGNAEAARIMAIINASYDALSDLEKRKAHDGWIVMQEMLAAHSERQASQIATSTQARSPQEEKATGGSVIGVISHVFRYRFWYGMVVFAIWMWSIIGNPSSPSPGPKPYQATPPAPSRQPAYVRPVSAPNGQPWPERAGYVKGYERLHASGLSTVTVDNSRNDSDVFVKLVSLDGPQAYPVRSFFIPAYAMFTLNKIDAGRYDVRYRDLSNGGLSRSEAFELEEIETQGGTQFSNLSMTLYKVQHGNMQTYRLSEVEF